MVVVRFWLEDRVSDCCPKPRASQPTCVRRPDKCQDKNGKQIKCCEDDGLTYVCGTSEKGEAGNCVIEKGKYEGECMQGSACKATKQGPTGSSVICS